jgi:F-type H+-transporting ATPase subunit delta
LRDRKLATRYARALLSLLDDAAGEKVASFLKALSESMEQSPATRDLLLDPAISRVTRKSILATLVQRSGGPKPLEYFLATVVDHNRTASLPSIAEVFHEELEKRMGIVPAQITTAAPMATDLQQHALRSLERATGRHVRLTLAVEPGLIGGAVTRVGSVVYDGSLRGQLEMLRAKMSQG